MLTVALQVIDSASWRFIADHNCYLTCYSQLSQPCPTYYMTSPRSLALSPGHPVFDRLELHLFR
jgi:hypothetical protein